MGASKRNGWAGVAGVWPGTRRDPLYHGQVWQCTGVSGSVVPLFLEQIARGWSSRELNPQIIRLLHDHFQKLLTGYSRPGARGRGANVLCWIGGRLWKILSIWQLEWITSVVFYRKNAEKSWWWSLKIIFNRIYVTAKNYLEELLIGWKCQPNRTIKNLRAESMFICLDRFCNDSHGFYRMQ